MRTNLFHIGLMASMFVSLLIFVRAEADGSVPQPPTEEGGGSDVPVNDVGPEKLEYAVGSVCGYCKYCQFCELCDKDCPCEVSKSKPNCHMCKYCSYCNLCSKLCDTICQPGGVLDKVSGAIVNSLPSVNHNEVMDDLKTVEEWTTGRDEL